MVTAHCSKVGVSVPATADICVVKSIWSQLQGPTHNKWTQVTSDLMEQPLTVFVSFNFSGFLNKPIWTWTFIYILKTIEPTQNFEECQLFILNLLTNHARLRMFGTKWPVLVSQPTHSMDIFSNFGSNDSWQDASTCWPVDVCTCWPLDLMGLACGLYGMYLLARR